MNEHEEGCRCPRCDPDFNREADNDPEPAPPRDEAWVEDFNKDVRRDS